MTPHLHGHCIVWIDDPEMQTHFGDCEYEYDDYCEDDCDLNDPKILWPIESTDEPV